MYLRRINIQIFEGATYGIYRHLIYTLITSAIGGSGHIYHLRNSESVIAIVQSVRYDKVYFH